MGWQSGLQFDASGNLLVAGTSGTNPFGSTTTAETAASVTPTNLGYAEGDIRRYGAVGAGEDNTAHINSALSVASKSGRPALFAGLNLKSTGGHIRDVATTAVDGQGAIIDFSGMATNGTAWTDTCLFAGSTNLNVQHLRNPMRNFVAIGTNTGTTVGLNITDTNDPGATFLTYYSVVFEQFNTGLLIGNNAYILKFYGCGFSRCATGLSLPQVLTNSAEQIAFFGCVFTDCSSIAIDNQNANTSLILYACSIDGNNITFIHHAHNPRTELYGCHLECLSLSSQSIPMLDIQGGHLLFSGGDLIASGGSPPGPASSVIDIPTATTVIFTDMPLLNNLGNSGGVLCSGAGNCYFLSPIKTFDITALPTVMGTAASYNLLQDGGFENANIIDNVGIIGDVTFTCSASTASPTVINATNHRQVVGQSGYFTTSGTMPTGLLANTVYYVSNVIDSSNFNVVYPGGSAVNVTGGGSGTLTYHAQPLTRTIGSHITLSNSTTQHHSGTQSLAAVLNGGVGASFAIFVKVKPGSYISTQGWYFSTQAVSLSLTNAFAADVVSGIGGAPLIIGGSNSTGVNTTAVLNTWTQFNTPYVQVPNWAKYYYLSVNLNAFFSSTLFLDDVVISCYGG